MFFLETQPVLPDSIISAGDVLFGSPTIVPSQESVPPSPPPPVAAVAAQTDRQMHATIGEPPPGKEKSLKQKGRNLAEYLAMASKVRQELPPRKQAGAFVEAFVDGLDDADVRKALEERMDQEGWSWHVVEVFLASIIISEEQQQQPRDESFDHVLKRQRRKRRYIPIVPVDEEEEDLPF